MHRVLWARAGAILLLFFASVAAFAADGRVINFTGTPTLNGAPITRPTPVSSGDTIATPGSSTVKVVMNDGSVLDLKAGTSVKISEFVYRKNQPSSWRSKLNLLRGAMRYVSGRIVKNDPDDASITAGATTIGIRGSFQSISFDGATVQVDAAIGSAIITFADGSTLSIQRGDSGTVNIQTQQTSLSTITTTDPVMQAAQSIADSGGDSATVQSSLAGQSEGDQALILAVLIGNSAALGVTDPNVLADAVEAAAGASTENAAIFALVASVVDPANAQTYRARAKAAAPDQADEIDEAGDIADEIEEGGEEPPPEGDGTTDDTTAVDTAENPSTDAASPVVP